MASVHEVIDALAGDDSTREHGTRFEELMVRYFELDPQLAAEYDRVWLWDDWPDRTGSDAGIDLVARQRETGDLTAVQCKFYAPENTLDLHELSTFFTASGKRGFTNRIIISTTDKWSRKAEEALADQQIPVQRIGLADLAASPVDWDIAWPTASDPVIELAPAPRHELRDHQAEAIDRVFDGWHDSDRGQLIMACGTGKTFTSLKIAEQYAHNNGGAARVLFLVPSISLLSQTLREWSDQTSLELRAFPVCSDTKVSKSSEDIRTYDLALPATTDAATLVDRVGEQSHLGLTVVFSTYQSLPVIAAAQQQGLADFDVVFCDEAHRTTGVTLAGADESHFVRIHDNTYIRAVKRLYMTATPKLFAEDTKAKAEEHSAVVSSMDDEDTFGTVFHRLTFGQAVEKGLLTDYKVLVLTVDEDYIAGPLQNQIVDENNEINLDDATRIVGCWNGLAKRAGADQHGNGFAPGEFPMRRAVAFLRDIKTSKRFAEAFEQVIDAYDGADDDVLDCRVHHVDGTHNALQRNAQLDWLKAPVADNECRILSNARCLSEGVDVPALDAVMFLNPRNSIVDVVQSVGRVMRKAPGKDYGYIILPVGVPSGLAPSEALADNKRFKLVWEVLNALRSHDDRFNAMVNSIELNKDAQYGEAGDSQLLGAHIGPTNDQDETLDAESQTEPDQTASQVARQAALFSLTDWRDAIYARIVKNVGTRAYWEDWATSVADIAARQQTRIHAAINSNDPTITEAFDRFVIALRENLNGSITSDDAISMLSQHLITRPIFDALFEDYSFAAHNPVSQVMQTMVDTLTGQGIDTETRDLESFYDSVRTRASGVTTATGKQHVITELYERFFKLAFARQADALGIVYTPVQIVDFLLRAANDALELEFGKSLSDDGVHILDGFTGTGTFIVRLLQSGIIRPEDLARKYASELHANEIMLLAYYIAAVNIEATYHGLTGGGYTPFNGIVLTDTFQISEAGDASDTSLFPANNQRIDAQLATPIQVIVGNPPYSVGQGSANDNNANVSYPTLDGRIGDTYAKRSTSGNKNSLYDSYIRALRWATDRIGDQGVIAYVTNGGWIDGNTADGLRLALADDFTSLYIYNLRGNARTSGELRRQEAGNTFGGGGRTTIAMIVGVKNPNHTGGCQIYYRDIGDYLSRDDKLTKIDGGHLTSIDWQRITPNQYGDWLNQRNDSFATFPAIGDRKNRTGETTIFRTYSAGLQTNRDAWVYNYSKERLEESVAATVDVFNDEAERYEVYGGGIKPQDFVATDPTQISWSSSLTPKIARGIRLRHQKDGYRTAIYRPFSRQHVYFDVDLNHRRGELSLMLPTPHHHNLGILVTSPGGNANFTCLVVSHIPDLVSVTGAGNAAQFFSRWTYEAPASVDGQLDLGDDEVDEWGYRRVDNITDAILAEYQSAFGPQVSKADIFYYVYGLLHSPQYRSEFAADLKKMLPRIPQPHDRTTFEAFSWAGRALAELHVNYETVEPYPLKEEIHDFAGQDERKLWRVSKMKWRSKTDKSAIIYNNQVTLSGIPDEAHEYRLGSRTALDWIIDQYRVKTDKKSGIINDPNEWCDEHDDPRYIIDLIKRITTVSVETVRIVNQLPELDLE